MERKGMKRKTTQILKWEAIKRDGIQIIARYQF